MHAPREPVIRFDAFELDTRSGELRKRGRRVRLPEQAFQVLSLLLAHPGEVVMRGDFQQRLWPSATAGDFDSGLNNAVKKLRDALGDSADAPRLIETVPRRGYRFLGHIAEPVAIQSPEPESGVEPEPAVEVAPALPQAAAQSRPRFAAGHVLAVLLLLLVGGATSYQVVSGSTESIRSIVVLPFDNLTGDASQDYFADSVSAALTIHLSEVSGLDVISRATARQLKQANTRIADIGKTVNVEGVVEGEVVRSGPNVRIMVKLIRVSTDRNVFARPYEASIEHMIGLQQRIASDLADAAGLPRPQQARRPQRTTNAQAYDAYVKGINAKGMQRYEGFERAARYFEEAIALQPDFAEAYAELALTRVQFLYGGPVSPREAITRAEEAAKEAIRLDDQLGQAHWALGVILNLYYWKFEEGGRSMKRAATLPGGRPNLANAALDPKEDFEEALAAAERGRALDANSVNAQVAVGSVYRRAGRYEEALREYRKAVAMSPQQPRLYFNLGITLIAMGRLHDAIRELEIATKPSPAHNTRFEAYLGYAYATAGRTREARAILSDLEAHRREGYVSWFGFALIHDALQEPEPALAALQRAYEDHAVELAMMNQYPAFRTIATDPRFQSIMKSVGLPR